MDKRKFISEITSIDWHYDLALPKLSSLNWKSKTVLENSEVIIVVRDSVIEINFYSPEAMRDRNSKDLPSYYAYNIGYNYYKTVTTTHCYNWMDTKGRFHRFSGAADIQIISQPAPQYLNTEHMTWYLYGHGIKSEQYIHWLSENNIDIYNITPEDKILIKMRWG